MPYRAIFWLYALMPCTVLAGDSVHLLAQQLLYEEPNAQLQQLGKISDKEGSLVRTFFSPAHKEAAKQIAAWMQLAGMETWIDAIGNVHGRISGSDASIPAVLIGSHYDTVRDAGKFDGTLGIIVGLAAVKMMLTTALLAQGVPQPAIPADGSFVALSPDYMHGVLKAPVHLVAFADEEGVRFQSTFLGSKSVAGTLLSSGTLHSRGKDGLSLEEVLIQSGVQDPAAELKTLAIDPNSISEYVEVHIEQGPVLERQCKALGVVSAIASQTRLWVSVHGTQGHAGTMPMSVRRDPMPASAHIIASIEQLCISGGGSGDKSGGAALEVSESDMLVCTVGELTVWPGASNVIPGNVQFSIDIRSKADGLRAEVVARVVALVLDVCAVRNLSCHTEQRHAADAVPCDPGIVIGLTKAIAESEELLSQALPSQQPDTACQQPSGSACSSVPEGQATGQCDMPLGAQQVYPEVPVMVSGAGHDAMVMAQITKMGMMFVRCTGGISHSPLEHVEPADVAAAAAALSQYLAGKLL